MSKIDTTTVFNQLKNLKMQVQCRAQIKSAREQRLIDDITQIARCTDTHISRLRFDRNPKAWGSTGTRDIKVSYSITDNAYELYINLAKVTDRYTGAYHEKTP
jgi:hypothetical protein